MRYKRGLLIFCLALAVVAALAAVLVHAQELSDRQKCENLGGVWFTNGPPGQQCCGDDKELGKDFMMVVNAGQPNAAMCIKTKKSWQWISRGMGGMIFRLEYEGVYKGGEAVFTDNGPRVCGPIVQGAFGSPGRLGHEIFTQHLFENDPFLEPRQVINGYECLRTAQGAYAIAECKGTHAANSEQSTNPTRVNDPGMNASAQDGVNLYCGSEGLWKPNLDSDKNACTLAGQLRIDAATKTVPIVWTGSRCCGEQVGESYDDSLGNPVRDAKGNYMPPYPVGGCWRGKPIRGTGKERRFVDDVAKTDPLFEQNGGEVINHSIINMNGSFHACQVSAMDLPAFTPVTIVTPPEPGRSPVTSPPGVNDRVWKLACANCPDIRVVSLSYDPQAHSRQVGFFFCDAGTKKQLYMFDGCQDGGDCKSYPAGVVCIKPQASAPWTYSSQSWCGATLQIAQTGWLSASSSVGATDWNSVIADKTLATTPTLTASGSGINVYRCTTPAGP